MNKYTNESDNEIEHLIAERKNKRIISRGIDRDIFVPKICRQYHDAMQLMIDNNMSLNSIAYSNKIEWWAFCFNGKGNNFFSINKNPCRAIAECYLLMKDAERSNEEKEGSQ